LHLARFTNPLLRLFTLILMRTGLRIGDGRQLDLAQQIAEQQHRVLQRLSQSCERRLSSTLRRSAADGTPSRRGMRGDAGPRSVDDQGDPRRMPSRPCPAPRATKKPDNTEYGTTGP
jgi:hypothetical protein